MAAPKNSTAETSSIKTDGASGTASIAIPISGPDGAATIYVEATQSAGRWTFSKLVVEFAGSKERIDLLARTATYERMRTLRRSYESASAPSPAIASGPAEFAA